MQDFIDMTKAQLAALIGGMTPAQIKKASHADLVQMAAPAKEPTLAEVVAGLTDLQKRVVVALLDAGIDVNGADTLDAMRADNMTFADVAELSQRTGLTKAQIKGVLSGLSGIVDTDVEKPNGQKGVDQVLTDWGVIVAFELLADGIEANPPKADKAPKAEKPAKAAPAPKKARVLEDRVLVAPATDMKMVRPVGEGTKRHLLLQALLIGATVEKLQEVTGWNRATAQSALRWDVPQAGMGCRREGDTYLLLLPAGVKAIPVKAKDQSRADALVAACR